MKLNKIMMAAVLAFGVTSVAQAADEGHGKVTFTGSIIDAPCSIHPDSLDQTKELGAISNIALKNGGKSVPRVFKIQLEQCDITTKNKVRVTFSGNNSAANNQLLGISGTARGASVAIADASNNLIPLDTATAPQTLAAGNNDLAFTAYLQGDGASATIVPGNFTAVANFTLAYP